MKNKKVFLALCLYEAIEDQNLTSIELLVEKHGANPNTIISDRQISPLHYIVGIEDQDFAVRVTRFFLRNGANPNIPSECEAKLTALHIACIWGHEKIVKLLLENGGDLSLNVKCGEGKTPILYAIHENHYEVIDVIKKFIFEQKIEKKKQELMTVEHCFDSPGKPLKNPIKHNVVHALQKLEDKKFTPNRINYNFDVTSPYYINITHRRFKSSKSSRSNDTCTMNSDLAPEKPEKYKKNLFELTEKNLYQFSKEISQTIIENPSTMEKRRSYIAHWRNKIQQIRDNENKIDINYLNYLNSCNNVTQIEDYPEEEVESIESNLGDDHDDEESFVTAECEIQQEKFKIMQENLEKFHIKSELSNKDSFMVQLTEEYIHSDQENGIVFLEKKILNEKQEKLEKITEEDAKSESSLGTRLTMPPLDYDTDVLRTELKSFGEAPGPITKSTKKLYLRQLVKYKKDPERMNQQRMMKDSQEKVYSVELQRTITNHSQLEERLQEYMGLEREMMDYFQKPNGRWREGHLKTSFIYLLIDPRISDNLPIRHKNMTKEEIWRKFLDSIFYVGKGKRSRPYAHLYDAIKLYSLENEMLARRLINRRNQVVERCVLYSNTAERNEIIKYNKQKVAQKSTKNPTKFQDSKKLNKIVEIWKSETGVVCLHIFHNVLPVDALTREAAIIDAIGLNNLTNLKRGDYYGLAATWKMRMRKNLGIALLYKALHVYLAEGESQLMPLDLI